MTPTQQHIADHLNGTDYPTTFTLRCFVGMIETGEATYNDFAAVGGNPLVAAVAHAKELSDDDKR